MIVLTDDFGTIRRLVEHLGAQTIVRGVELVVVCPSAKDVQFPAGLTDALARVTVVEFPLLPMGAARATAVRAATGPIIVLGETHAFPSPDWAEQLIRAHGGPWEAVSPGMENGNPESALSWSGFLMDYGRWLAERPSGEIAEPPSYNASWRREALIGLQDRLELMLAPGGGMDEGFLVGGAVFQHESHARVAHLNIARLGAWAAERYWAGRVVGARRCREWSLVRRLVYFGGSVLVPLIRFVQTRAAIVHARRRRDLPTGTLAAVAGGSLLWAFGEALGYLAGEGQSEARMLEYELHKERYT